MERHVCVSGPLHPVCDSYLESSEVHHDADFSIAVVHSGDVKHGGMELYELRRSKLLAYLVTSLLMKPHPMNGDAVHEAVVLAFYTMDDEVQQRVKDSQLPKPFLYACRSKPSADIFWRCQYNTAVVVIHAGAVYAVGHNRTTAVICRGGRDLCIIPKNGEADIWRLSFSRGNSVPRENPVFFRQEPLTREDNFLVMASRGMWRHLTECDITAVLETRVAAFGLEEACRQMVGSMEADSKVLVVLTLRPQPHTYVHPPARWSEWQRDALLPLQDGKAQSPAPHLSMFSGREAIPPQVTSTGPPLCSDVLTVEGSGDQRRRALRLYRSFKIVVQFGDIEKWHITDNGSVDAVVKFVKLYPSLEPAVVANTDGDDKAYYTISAAYPYDPYDEVYAGKRDQEHRHCENGKSDSDSETDDSDDDAEANTPCPELISNAYTRPLRVASELRITHVAIPAISSRLCVATPAIRAIAKKPFVKEVHLITEDEAVFEQWASVVQKALNLR